MALVRGLPGPVGRRRHAHARARRLDLDLVDVRRRAGHGPDVAARPVHADARQRERDGDVDVGGEARIASRAVPEKTSVGSVRASGSRPMAAKCGAPARPFGDLRVTIRTDDTSPRARAPGVTSRPRIAPVGTMRRWPAARKAGIRSSRRASWPTERTIRTLAGGEGRVGDLVETCGGQAFDNDISGLRQRVERQNRRVHA